MSAPRILLACAALALAANTPLPPPAAEQDASVKVFRVAERAQQAGFAGTVLVGFTTWHSLTCHPIRAGCDDEVWRWASVTKQIVATLVLQQVATGTIDLDQPVARYLPDFRSPNAATLTVRQLLRHQSGLPNPDDTARANPDAMPSYYTDGYRGSRDPLRGYCAGPVTGPPGGNWAYNNCDYIVAGALLRAVTGKSWDVLVRERIATPFGLTSVGAFPRQAPTVAAMIDGKPEPPIRFASFAAAAGLYGTVGDLWRFDRALLTGALLPPAQRAALWDGQPQLGSIALGQWVFTAPLSGCAKPVRIVERRGEIGGVGVRNFILPDSGRIVIAFTNRGGYDFGEVWQGKGLSFDLLSAAACP